MSFWERVTSEAPAHVISWVVAGALGGFVWLFRTVFIQSIEREATRQRLDSIDRRLDGLGETMDEIHKFLREQ